jgi:hypothetical protein
MIYIKLAAFLTSIVFLQQIIFGWEKFGTAGAFAGIDTLIV